MVDLIVPVSTRDHVRGPENANLTLVQYGDIQCPHCALAHPIINQLVRELNDSLQVVFRHFPLTEIHPLAQRGAEVVEAAASQGRFWEMLDLLYANSDGLDEESFTRFARKIKLDFKTFSRELDRAVHRDRIRADYLGGGRSGVKGTPTFFINRQRYRGPIDFDAMVAALYQASRAAE